VAGSTGNIYIKVGLDGQTPLLHCTPYILSVDDL